VIPTYNRADRLLRVLATVESQTRAPDEVIVVDDGSTDDTPQQIPRGFPRVRYVRQENRGVSAARNRGVHEAGGQWIAFLDSDDEWLPQKLERQLEALRQNPEFVLCHTNEVWIRRGRRVNPMKKHEKHGGNIFKKCLPLCVISPSSVLLDRKVFEHVGVFDESLPVCEDYDLWLRVSAEYPALYLEEPLIVKHGGHPDQLSRRYWGMDRFRIRALEKVLRSDKLSPGDRRAAVQALVDKIDRYLPGTRKRGKWEEVANYEEKKAHYASLFHVGQPSNLQPDAKGVS
jgi:glycosyltransferase involved in cell wall biosynthesis